MKKMNYLFRTMGILITLLLLFSLSACTNVLAETVESPTIEELQSADTTIEKVPEYTLSLKENVLTLNKDGSIIVSEAITGVLTTCANVHSSTRYVYDDVDRVEFFLSMILVRETIILFPTTFEEIGFDPMAPNRYFVGFNSDSNLYIMFQTDGQMIVHNLRTDEVYISKPGVVDVQAYYQFRML